MVARVTRYKIRPGMMEEFVITMQDLIPAMDKLHGFRALVILRGEEIESRDAMSISVWNSTADMNNSENDDFYYKGLMRLMKCCESFSPGRGQEVLLSKFANPSEESRAAGL